MFVLIEWSHLCHFFSLKSIKHGWKHPPSSGFSLRLDGILCFMCFRWLIGYYHLFIKGHSSVRRLRRCNIDPVRKIIENFTKSNLQTACIIDAIKKEILFLNYMCSTHSHSFITHRYFSIIYPIFFQRLSGQYFDCPKLW